ncbi:MAG: glutamate--tRNA ligase [Candidatus Desulfofervidaceae bacterium]|nr:glutamate--tRNA ligase [Candidatus Desulfofervidaceae bacterium]
MSVRVRFAPSPTGKLHLGNARTAIFNWLFARQLKGKFVLRIEDTDKERSSPEYEQQLKENLKWLGLSWDEGPDEGGPFAPYRQSERLEIYQHYLKKLLEQGRAYYCYCSQEELEAERKLCLAQGHPPRYSGKCRHLTETKRRRYEAEGRRPTIRFIVPDEVVEFTDLLKGKMRFYAGDIGDFVIVRSNGLPAYNFAVVIDDALMQISHVIRGEDHLANTACQILLYEALGLARPEFAHHPLLLGADRSKLSKRHGAVSVEEYRREGFLPEALFYYLATIGTGGKKEILDKEALIAQFDLSKMGRGNAVFDHKRLLWINKHFLRALPPETILDHVRPFLPADIKDRNKVEEIIALIRENIETLKGIKEFWPIFSQAELELTDEVIHILKQDEAKTVLNVFYKEFDITPQKYDEIFKKIQQKTGLKGRKLMLPLRLALTGRRSGPELHKILSFLPSQWIKARIEKALRNT